MIEKLLSAYVPIILSIIVALLWFYLREVIKSNVNKRTAIEEEMLRRGLNYLDQQLNQFYLPINERLSLSKLIYEKMERLQDEKKEYQNPAIGIESRDDYALRNIVVRRVYMPLNTQVERLILNKSYLKFKDDPTNYSEILAHFRLWRAFEEAMSDGEINDYEGTILLKFPSKEANHLMQACDSLLNRRNDYRKKIENICDSMMRIKRERGDQKC